jgi:hypothetical protein
MDKAGKTTPFPERVFTDRNVVLLEAGVSRAALHRKVCAKA